MSSEAERDFESTRFVTVSRANLSHVIELYQAEDCPYYEKVREKLIELGLSYLNHNPRTAGGATRNQQPLEEMETVGGQDRIPFLVDRQHGVELYESVDIVNHLEEHYS